MNWQETRIEDKKFEQFVGSVAKTVQSEISLMRISGGDATVLIGRLNGFATELKELRDKQAEVSFKAGQEAGAKMSQPDVYDMAFADGQQYSFTANCTIQSIKDEAKQAGRKEVVEWLKQFAIHGGKGPVGGGIANNERTL